MEKTALRSNSSNKEITLENVWNDDDFLINFYDSYYDISNNESLGVQNSKQTILEDETENISKRESIKRDLSLGNVLTDNTSRITYARNINTWEGYVVSINEQEGEFDAILEDPKIPFYEEKATFYIEDDVDPADKELFKVGATFYWTVGSFIIKGQLKKQSELRFKRIPSLTSTEVDEILDRAKKLNEELF